MITSILNKLDLASAGGDSAAGFGSLGGITQIFGEGVAEMIPPYFLQIAIGVYLVQIIFILTGTLVTIDSGEDKLQKTNKTGKNLLRGIILYFITALLATVVLFVLGVVVLGNI